MFDLDHFKRINDRSGHLSGDTVLRHFAQFLTTRLRREDSLGRFGGEEFLVLLPNSCPDGLAQSMLRLLADLAKERPLKTEPDFAYSCSIGLSLLHRSDRIETALDRVDSALYSAKEQGRNRYVWAAPPP